MKHQSTILLLLIPLCFALSQEENCENCCDDKIKLSGFAELCLEHIWCQKKDWTNENRSNLISTRYENATFVRINPEAHFKVIRRCTVQNFKKLGVIFAENKGIELIDSDAFWHLPELKSIYFAFNLLKELHYGMFSNLTATILDLSWNELQFISENAFEGMENLKNLNLSHNKLTEFDIFYTPIDLDELILSHNFLTGININTEDNFSVLDLSFNKLERFTIFYLTEHGKIDLTNNNLKSIWWAGGTVNDLRLSLNNLTDMEPLVGNEKNLSSVTLFPNPWKCEQLDTYYKDLIRKNVTILEPEVDGPLTFQKKTYPICAIPNQKAYQEYEKVRQNFINEGVIPCENDKGCPNFMICRSKQCWDPCKYNSCRGKNCATKNHKYSCRCPKGMLSSHLQLFYPCHIPCFESEDCPVFHEEQYHKCDYLHHVCVYAPI